MCRQTITIVGNLTLLMKIMSCAFYNCQIIIIMIIKIIILTLYQSLLQRGVMGCQSGCGVGAGGERLT